MSGNFTNPSTMTDQHWRTRKRKMELLVVQSGINLGPELVTNGQFPVNVVGWVVGGTALVTHDSGLLAMSVDRNGSIDVVVGHASQVISGLTIGRSYRIVADILTLTGIGTDVNLMMASVIMDNSLIQGIRISGVRVAVATSETVGIRILGDVNGIAVVDNISVREII